VAIPLRSSESYTWRAQDRTGLKNNESSSTHPENSCSKKWTINKFASRNSNSGNWYKSRSVSTEWYSRHSHSRTICPMIGFDILSVIPVTLARCELGTARAWQNASLAKIVKHYTSSLSDLGVR
jgi:hypothetical protein